MEGFRLLNAEDIEVKVKKVTDKGVVLLLYKTARTDMDLLDERFGAENWECDYREIKGNLYCGIESREDDEGNQKKGEASDAFKRAGFKWGIGRELYTAPFIFVSADKVTIRDGRKTFDTFRVEKIAYEGRTISGISIINNSTGKRCYVWTKGEAG